MMEKRYIFWSSFLTLTLIIRASCECFTDSYNGTISKTISGLACQRWDNWYPHLIDESHRIGFQHADYCRNPNGTDYIWCYTLDPDVRTERCAITKCALTTALSSVTTDVVHVTTDAVPVTTHVLYVTTNAIPVTTDAVHVSTTDITSASSTQNDVICYCPCDSVSTHWFNGNLTDEEKVENITKEKEKIRAELLIDIKGLSSYKRKKKCAEDNRLVAVSIGRSLGIGVIFTVICLIILADIHTFRMVLRKQTKI